jgi:glutaminyl-tRNA synthetase
VPFTKEIYIEQDDFQETPHKDFFRLAPGKEVRLRYAYCITCTHIDKDRATGAITAIHCTYDPETKSGMNPVNRKVKGTIHWVSSNSLTTPVRLYHPLLLDTTSEEEEDDFRKRINPHSLEALSQSRVEISLKQAKVGEHYQFERQGYFFVDPVDSTPERPVFNRVVSLKDSWSKKKA